MMYNRNITLVAAMDLNRGIGVRNTLPWPRLRADMVRFRTMTESQSVIMGRKTWDSLGGKPLSNRQNIVLTRDPKLLSLEATHSGWLSYVSSLEQAVEMANRDIFIIGGQDLYEQTIEHADAMYLTRVETAFLHCDAFFPEFWMGMRPGDAPWTLTACDHVAAHPNTPIALTFLGLARTDYTSGLARASQPPFALESEPCSVFDGVCP